MRPTTTTSYLKLPAASTVSIARDGRAGESTAVIAHSVPSQQCANIVVALLRVGPIEAARGGLVLIRHAKVVHLERNRPLGELLQRHRCLRSPTVICRVVIELCEQVILGFDGSEDQRNAAQTA